MKLKDGVSLEGLEQVAKDATVIVDSVYHRHGSELTVTSTTEGKHKKGSLHYEGKAFDCRTKHLGYEKVLLILAEIKAELGKDFDVILEEDKRTPRSHPRNTEHIHVEYDPKVKKRFGRG